MEGHATRTIRVRPSAVWWAKARTVATWPFFEIFVSNKPAIVVELLGRLCAYQALTGHVFHPGEHPSEVADVLRDDESTKPLELGAVYPSLRGRVALREQDRDRSKPDVTVVDTAND